MNDLLQTLALTAAVEALAPAVTVLAGLLATAIAAGAVVVLKRGAEYLGVKIEAKHEATVKNAIRTAVLELVEALMDPKNVGIDASKVVEHAVSTAHLNAADGVRKLRITDPQLETLARAEIARTQLGAIPVPATTR